ncbi:MAG: 2-aminoethylphosphonate--pyruvate transaminase [Deltaproteobacteria bacterium]|nr:2-aminoethylphosphonate--pyruvate transaminase [Deltaproteobacteria bacterium]MBW1985664.1 2-aminoethylphosphonate--pyruvate transaminase [Deltaproteobacteria bacterium]MBW2134577.1 2-aminoethylphosphonate--pyruvate transaminase [Deltaproteobacteria bacterium]
MISVARKILLNPGPATTTDTVKAALVVPDICPREQEFVEVMRQVRQDLVQIAGGDVDFHTCVLLAGSGTAAMDAVLNSVIPPNRGVAVINNGAYGARLAEIARCYQLPLVEINFAWGAWPDLELIDQTIQSNPEISHLALVHHETSTGMLNPLPEIAALAQDRGLSLIVDAISSLGGVPVDVRQQHIDYLLCTSNKCLQGMAGLSWVICRREALEQSGELPGRSYYLNLYQQWRHFEANGQMRFTPPVQVVYALAQAIREYLAEGAENRFRRYRQNWQTLVAGLHQLGFKTLLPEAQQSPLLTTVLEPDDPHYHFGRLHDALYQRGFTIYPGKLKNDRTFRLANMGAINPEDIKEFLAALREVLEELQIKVI